MDITPVTYKEACEILGCKYTTLIAATERGVFIKLPVTGPEQKIIKEQIQLFIGKKQLKLAALSKEERKAWEEIEEATKVTPASKLQPIGSTPSLAVNMDANQFVRALIDNGVVSTGNHLTFQSALADEEDSKKEDASEQAKFGILLLVILIGLVWLFAQETKEKAARIAERTIEQLGLEKEDLTTNQREVIATLRQHPREARELKRILDTEGYPNPLAVA